MEIKRKPTALALAFGVGAWELVLKPIWTLNVERVAERQQIDTTLSQDWRIMDALSVVASYVPSSFGLGFVCGAVLFAYWDVISALFRRWILRREPESDIRAWVGNIVPYFDLTKDGCAHLFIYLIGVGSTPFRITSVSGRITLQFEPHSGKRRSADLPTPAISDNPTQDGAMGAGFFGLLVLTQPIPAEIAQNVPATFGWKPYPALLLEKLNISLSSEDGKATTRLRLWDSMRLSAGDDQIRAVETVKMFKDSEDAQKHADSVSKLSRWFGGR